MTRQPDRLRDLLPEVFADIEARHRAADRERERAPDSDKPKPATTRNRTEPHR